MIKVIRIDILRRVPTEEDPDESFRVLVRDDEDRRILFEFDLPKRIALAARPKKRKRKYRRKK